jgi:hypothetical protein
MEGEKYNPSLLRLWRVWRTTKEMLNDRGYLILEDDMTLSLEDFSKRYAREDGEPEYALTRCLGPGAVLTLYPVAQISTTLPHPRKRCS